MREDGWDIACAIEYHPEVKKARAMVKATRKSMPQDRREYVGHVVMEVHKRHAAKIIGDPLATRALLSWALMRLCEEAEMAEFDKAHRLRVRGGQ